VLGFQLFGLAKKSGAFSKSGELQETLLGLG
jgi:hypothetical protein